MSTLNLKGQKKTQLINDLRKNLNTTYSSDKIEQLILDFEETLGTKHHSFTQEVKKEDWTKQIDNYFSVIITHELNSNIISAFFYDSSNTNLYMAYEILDENRIEINSIEDIPMKIIVNRKEDSYE